MLSWLRSFKNKNNQKTTQKGNMEMGHFLQVAGDFIYNFFIIGIIGYIIKKWLADRLIHGAKVWINQTERNMAIWDHYQSRARGRGHAHDSVLDCDQDKCTVFKEYAS